MKTIKLFITIGTLTLSVAGFSQTGFDAVRIFQDEMGFGARALGMGGAYTAVANDYSSIYWNPAGLADLRRSEFLGEISHLNFGNQATFADQISTDKQNYANLGSIGLAFPLPTQRGSFAIALGYNRVKNYDENLSFSGFNRMSNGLGFDFEDNQGNTVFYPFDKNVQQSEQIMNEGGLNQWSFGSAIALSPNFNVGVSANFYSGKDEYHFTFLQEDVDNIYDGNNNTMDYDSYELNETLISKYKGFGLKIGGMLNVARGIKLGAAVGLPVTMNVKETHNKNDLITFDNGDQDPFDYGDGVFEYEVKTPIHYDGGISLSNSLITLSGSVRYRDWSQTKFQIPDGFQSDPDYAELLQENERIKKQFGETFQYNLGGELYLGGLMLRGGYGYYPSPLKDASKDLDKEFISGGIGLRVDRTVSLDITYLRGQWKRETGDELTPGGTLEEITTNKFIFGLTYRF